MSIVNAPPANGAYGHPAGAVRRRRPTILACLHQTANTAGAMRAFRSAGDARCSACGAASCASCVAAIRLDMAGAPRP